MEQAVPLVRARGFCLPSVLCSDRGESKEILELDRPRNEIAPLSEFTRERVFVEFRAG